MHKSKKIFFAFIAIFLSAIAFSSVNATTTTATSSSTSTNPCHEGIKTAQATIKQEHIAKRKEIAEKGIKSTNSRVETYSCLEDIWSNITSYFSGDFSFDLSSLLDAARDLACDTATSLAKNATDAVTDGIEASIKGAGYAVKSAYSSAMYEYTRDLKGGLYDVENLTDIKGGYTGFITDKFEDKLDIIDDEYRDTLYAISRDAKSSVSDTIKQ